MRDKRRSRARPRDADGSPPASGPGTADWVLANEAGWGFPHGGVVLLAGLVVGARAVGWLIRRAAAAGERPPRRDGD